MGKGNTYFSYDISPEELEAFAKSPVPGFAEYLLWHVPSGPLPLLAGNTGGRLKLTKEDWQQDATIPDPRAGWVESRPGANTRMPYFGAGHPGVIHLEIKLSPQPEIPVSGFRWIGNHYKIIGNEAKPTTEKFWNKLRRMAKKVGTHIPRGNMAGGKNEVYAFPAAYAEIKSGRPCSVNP